ncbi:MAG: hypothetical protein N3D80_07565 [Ignavibacterium album]|jgi:hypothetical protein|uniref:hypothetical protein n=1 Tax=Ignavibacterium album TaxID=591197 RepID=UPI0026F18E2C|nr:hypothetical protein [Ignavibacterium album]MCX8105708.1 hypothetical protein [Ignavibacterium album]
MKETVILWLSSLVIVFLLSYFKSVFGEYYPITGTFSIEGQKITYKVDKVEYGNTYKLLVRSDYENLDGEVVITSDAKRDYRIKLNKADKILFAEINKKVVGNNFSYSLSLTGNNKVYRIPKDGEINFTFFGKIPKMVEWLYLIFLYSGLVLMIRTGLEHFKTNRRTKNFLVLTSIVWLTFLMMINPLYLSYKYEYINKSIPPIQNLFPIDFLITTTIWLAVTVFVFLKKKDKPVVLLMSIISLLIYLFS